MEQSDTLMSIEPKYQIWFDGQLRPSDMHQDLCKFDWSELKIICTNLDPHADRTVLNIMYMI